jgi:hypothetical protein
VFATMPGHNNDTVADPRYLDLVTRGLLRSASKLDAEHLEPAGKCAGQGLRRAPRRRSDARASRTTAG